jgi:hypothetical protein
MVLPEERTSTETPVFSLLKKLAERRLVPLREIIRRMGMLIKLTNPGKDDEFYRPEFYHVRDAFFNAFFVRFNMIQTLTIPGLSASMSQIKQACLMILFKYITEIIGAHIDAIRSVRSLMERHQTNQITFRFMKVSLPRFYADERIETIMFEIIQQILTIQPECWIDDDSISCMTTLLSQYDPPSGVTDIYFDLIFYKSDHPERTEDEFEETQPVLGGVVVPMFAMRRFFIYGNELSRS